jgi:subtilisin family serine protease
MQGIEDAIANHADIISLSVGATVDLTTGEGAGLKAAFDQVTNDAAQAGIIVVASAGNEGLDLSDSRFVELPAQSSGVLAIEASTNPNCAQNTAAGATCAPGPIGLAYYSNHGAPLNALAAPGGSYPEGGDLAVSGWVRGACSSGKPSTVDGPPSDSSHSFGCFNFGHTPYVQAIGTSASAPLAAGAAALLRAAHPDWTAAAIIATLRSTATPSPSLPVSQIDAAAALAVH